MRVWEKKIKEETKAKINRDNRLERQQLERKEGSNREKSGEREEVRAGRER